MNYADTFELPVIATINGEEKALKPLTQRDYQPWLAELTAKRREADLKLIPPTVKGTELFNLKRQIDLQEVLPADVEPLIYTAEGAVKVLELALVKNGLTADEAAKFIDEQPVAANTALALRVSGLISRARLESFAIIDGPNNPRQKLAEKSKQAENP